MYLCVFVCVPQPPTGRWSWSLMLLTASAWFGGKRGVCSCIHRRSETFPAQRETSAPRRPDRDRKILKEDWRTIWVRLRVSWASPGIYRLSLKQCWWQTALLLALWLTDSNCDSWGEFQHKTCSHRTLLCKEFKKIPGDGLELQIFQQINKK